jgi:hypothetical protein
MEISKLIETLKSNQEKFVDINKNISKLQSQNAYMIFNLEKLNEINSVYKENTNVKICVSENSGYFELYDHNGKKVKIHEKHEVKNYVGKEPMHQLKDEKKWKWSESVESEKDVEDTAKKIGCTHLLYTSIYFTEYSPEYHVSKIKKL